MSDTAIFAVGLFTFLLLSGGLVYTLIEVPRLHRKDINKPESLSPDIRTSPQ